MDPYGPVWVRMVPGDSLGASWGLLGPWGLPNSEGPGSHAWAAHEFPPWNSVGPILESYGTQWDSPGDPKDPPNGSNTLNYQPLWIKMSIH